MHPLFIFVLQFPVSTYLNRYHRSIVFVYHSVFAVILFSPVQNKPAPRFCLENPEFLTYHAVSIMLCFSGNHISPMETKRLWICLFLAKSSFELINDINVEFRFSRHR